VDTKVVGSVIVIGSPLINCSQPVLFTVMK